MLHQQPAEQAGQLRILPVTSQEINSMRRYQKFMASDFKHENTNLLGRYNSVNMCSGQVKRGELVAASRSPSQ